jgi:hypothetical protein
MMKAGGWGKIERIGWAALDRVVGFAPLFVFFLYLSCFFCIAQFPDRIFCENICETGKTYFNPFLHNGLLVLPLAAFAAKNAFDAAKTAGGIIIIWQQA